VKRRPSRLTATPAAQPAGSANAGTAIPDEVLTLTVLFAGRICFVTAGGRQAALFLDAQANRGLGHRRHYPRLRAPLGQTTQQAADAGQVTFLDHQGRAHVLWDLEGHDVRFDGLADVAAPTTDVSRLPDLRTAYSRVDANAEWRDGEVLLGADPRAAGIAARVWLDGFSIDTMFFDANGGLKPSSEQTPDDSARLSRLFVPGDHRQEVHAVMRCTATFRPTDANGPAVLCRPFGAASFHRYEFDDDANLRLSMSNLCSCVGEHLPMEVIRDEPSGAKQTWELEDSEFAMFFELLRTPPSTKRRPLPFLKKGAGFSELIECYSPARLAF
jgi:hypothetical protein